MNDAADKALIRSALAARKRAHAPYSGFAVGAAIRVSGGKTVCGCNVENASYGLTVCAEGVAAFKAVSRGFDSFRALAVAVPGDEPMPPCGACLQVLAEFCGKDIPIIMVAAGSPGRPVRTCLRKLLPHAFSMHERRGASRC